MPDIDFQRIVLNVIPKQGDEPVVFYASQYETTRPFIADLFWGDTEFAPGLDCWAEIDIRKNDDNLVVITDDVAIDNNEVSVILPVQAVTCIGKNLGQIKIYAGEDQLVAALNFILEVQPDPLAGGVTSETAIDNLTTQIDDIISGEGYVKDTDLDVLQSDWDEADPTSPTYIKNKPSSGTQVQADWTESDITSPAYIKNKPSLAAVATTGDYDDLLDKPDLKAVATSGSYNDLTDKPTIPAAQVQSDYAQTNSAAVDYIKNKPELPFETKGQYLLKTTPAMERSIEFTILIGGTCGVNQLVQNGNFADTSGWSFTNGTATASSNICHFTFNATANRTELYCFIANTNSTHDYLFAYTIKSSKAVSVASVGGAISKTFGSLNANLEYVNITIVKGGNNTLLDIYTDGSFENGDTVDYKNIMLIDLTQMFGTTIADYVYTLESGTSGAGITWLKNNGFFNEAYYPYNAGGLLSVKTIKKINRGFNQWDEEWELGDLGAHGENVPNSTMWRAKNYIPVLPNTEYYLHNGGSGNNDVFFYDINKQFILYQLDKDNKTFVTPANAYYMRFYTTAETTYNHDICINISDANKNGTYKPYVSHEYPLNGSRKVHRVFGIVDLGSLTYSKYEDALLVSGAMFYIDGVLPDCKQFQINETPNAICLGYTVVSRDVFDSTDKSIAIVASGSSNLMCIQDSSLSSLSTADFKTAMSGKYLVYELATPFDETVNNPELRGVLKLDSNNNLYYYGDTCSDFTNPMVVDGNGTEEFVDGRTVEMPVGNDTFYIPTELR